MRRNVTMARGLVRLAGVVALLAAACGPYAVTPPAPTMPAPSSTQAPPSGLAPAPTPAATARWLPAGAPEHCVAPEKGQPQSIVGTPASPYFVRHPIQDNPDAPTVVFLGGGSGNRRSAQRIWTNYLSGGAGVDAFRIVLPYSIDVEYLDYYEARRTFKVVDEVLACYGGDPAQVHLAGFSNGGYVAFELMLEHPERFATLLGAPGLFPRPTTPEQWAKALCGHAVFNGVGAQDEDWKQDVRTTHEGLLKMGIASVYVEFEGQRHSLNEAFDETVLFDFWRANGPDRAAKSTEGKKGC
ncbi:MAG: hypothetical protein HY331_13300 [Chloroflexi bacterium]|nr:hypothetical protein [Chloroflexota bacterium]